MAKKVVKKNTATKKAAKPVAKKAVKVAPKKAVKTIAKKVVKAAPKKAVKPVAKKAAPKKAVKPVAKKAAPKKAVKPVAKKSVNKATPKKVVKVAPKKVIKTIAKKVAKKIVKVALKKVVKTIAKKVVKVTPKKVVKTVAKKLVKVAPKKVVKTIAKKVVKVAPKKVVNTVAKKVVKTVAKKPATKTAPVKIVKPVITKVKVEKVKVFVEKPVVVKVKVGRKEKLNKFGKLNRGIKDLKRQKDDNRGPVPIIEQVSKPLPKIEVKNTDMRNRYSDEELLDFKVIIDKKLDDAKKDFEILKDTLSHRDDHGTDDTSPTFKLLEDGSDVMSREETAQLAQRQQKFIDSLEQALIRIANKTYGICRVTGRLISKERLRSVPHATLSIEAKNVINNQ